MLSDDPGRWGPPLGTLVLLAGLLLVVSLDADADTIVEWAHRGGWAPLLHGYYPGAGDLDGDGDSDLIVCQPLGALENTGGGLWPSWAVRDEWVDGLVLPYSFEMAELGDLDSDGDSDLLVSFRHSGVLFYENTGTVWSPEWTRNDDYLGIPGIYGSAGAGVGDLDGDGDLDIVTSGWMRLYCYWNEGTPADPSWREDLTIFAGISPGNWPNTAGSDPNLADLDGDGDLDLVAAPEAGTGPVESYENVGSDASPIWLPNQALLTGVPALDDLKGACLVDLNSDGRPDFLPFGVWSADCYRNEGADSSAVAEVSWGRVKTLYRRAPEEHQPPN